MIGSGRKVAIFATCGETGYLVGYCLTVICNADIAVTFSEVLLRLVGDARAKGPPEDAGSFFCVSKCYFF